ncbi:transposable element Tcb2 transposase [Trichonephila clavipes]|nr:transposable element Tcb2 transposase [Trichonephila clavipes]
MSHITPTAHAPYHHRASTSLNSPLLTCRVYEFMRFSPYPYTSISWIQFETRLIRPGNVLPVIQCRCLRAQARRKALCHAANNVDARRYPRAENRVWSDQEDHEEKGDVRQALVDPTVTRSTIRANVGVAIVPQTISRHFAEANLKSKRPFREPPLTPEHRQLRLQWCQARSMWNVTDWQKVVFSGESRFFWGQMITV